MRIRMLLLGSLVVVAGVLGPAAVAHAQTNGKDVSKEEEKAWRMLQLLTSKPALYVANVDEESAGDGNGLSAQVVGTTSSLPASRCCSSLTAVSRPHRRSSPSGPRTPRAPPDPPAW